MLHSLNGGEFIPCETCGGAGVVSVSTFHGYADAPCSECNPPVPDRSDIEPPDDEMLADRES